MPCMHTLFFLPFTGVAVAAAFCGEESTAVMNDAELKFGVTLGILCIFILAT